MIFKSSESENGHSIQSAMARAMTSVAFGALCFPGAAFAQDAAPQADAEVTTDDNAIIVTARRDAENVQDVPVSVQVVTGDKLEKLAITSVEEVSKLAPGLTLVNAGSNTSVNFSSTVRGSAAPPDSADLRLGRASELLAASSSPTYIVGTPMKIVHFCATSRSSAAAPSKRGSRTTVAPT